jgi:hypothetical protein
MDQRETRQLKQDVDLLKAAVRSEGLALPHLSGSQREIALAGIEERRTLIATKEAELAGRSILDLETLLADLQTALVALDRANDIRNIKLHEWSRLKSDGSEWARGRLPDALAELKKADADFERAGAEFRAADQALFAAHQRKILHGTLRSPNGGERKQ